MEPAISPSDGHWPGVKTLPTLQSELRRLSKTNGKLILEIAKADRIYVELVYRGKELEAQEN
jgi:hypothetical protein